MPRWKKYLAWSKVLSSGKLMLSRILALDYGTKRIGVALSDELGWTAQPLETFERRTLDRDIAHIASLVKSHEVGKVVLGLPLQLDGREGPAILAMREFSAKLEQGVPVPVVLWDERMTTKAAEDLLIAADVSRKKRKGAVDRVAAAILLQSYLASLESAATRERRTESDADSDADSTTVETSDETQGHSGSSARRGHRSRHGRISGDSVG
jgi:putative Holliday junction resolvase